MDRSELLEKARKLPLAPGVYIMKNAGGKVIYVGKSKLLRNRVSSYFMHNSSHTAKTEKMVASARDFEVYFTSTEIEALVLENQFIKQYMPKYNIKLKDSKGYPYIKVTQQTYPHVTVAYKRDDTSTYYGPFSSASVAHDIADAVLKAMLLPQCKKDFPRDFGTRPCLNYHIGACLAPCRGTVGLEEYLEHVSGAKRILRGEIKPLIAELTEQMETAAQEMCFEQAAKYRDCIAAVKKLDSQQKIVTSPEVNEDVFGFYSDELGSAAAILMIRSGAIADREHFFFPADEILDSGAATALMQRFYQLRGFIPPTVLCDTLVTSEDRELIEDYLVNEEKSKVNVVIPIKGDRRKIVGIANENAKELLMHYRSTIKRENDFLMRLTQFLSLEIVPSRIEAYDISNNGEHDTTAGMIVIEDGKFCKKKYRSFNITSTASDDYGAMSEAITRRLGHSDGDWCYPDLILVDGGVGHVTTVKNALAEKGIELPVLGMVKDEFHKTRTLTDGENEISIAKNQEIFVFFYKIQEEVHRYSLSRMDVKRRKTVRHSVLESIKGIGEAKAKLLNARFGGLRGVREATEKELMSVKSITEKDAHNIFMTLRGNKDGEE